MIELVPGGLERVPNPHNMDSLFMRKSESYPGTCDCHGYQLTEYEIFQPLKSFVVDGVQVDVDGTESAH